MSTLTLDTPRMMHDMTDAHFHSALCRQTDPDMFFPSNDSPKAIDRAKAICDRCIHKQPCAAFAIRNRIEHGIWGGTSDFSPPKDGMGEVSVPRDARPALRVSMLVAALALTLHPVRLSEAVTPTNDAAHYIGTITPTDPRTYVRQRASRDRGWRGSEWTCLRDLIQRESSWRLHAKNPHSSARGLFQMLRQRPNMSLADQTRIGLRYIAHRHHTPCQAIAFHDRHGWY